MNREIAHRILLALYVNVAIMQLKQTFSFFGSQGLIQNHNSKINQFQTISLRNQESKLAVDEHVCRSLLDLLGSFAEEPR